MLHIVATAIVATALTAHAAPVPGRVDDTPSGRSNEGAADTGLAGTPCTTQAVLRTRLDAVRELGHLLGRHARVVETAHFVIVHTAPDTDAAALGRRLEGLYAANMKLAREIGIRPRAPEWRLEVVYCGLWAEFDAVRKRLGAPAESRGFYVRSLNRCVFSAEPLGPSARDTFLADEQARGATAETASLRWRAYAERVRSVAINHEAAHCVQFNVGFFDRESDVPLWLVEGFAQAFELWRPGREDVLSQPHAARAARFCRDYPDAAALESLLPRIIADNAAWDDAEHQALGWALVHYLWRARHDEFAQYARAVASSDRSAVSASVAESLFTAHLGVVDRAFVERFHSYLRRYCDVGRTPSSQTRFCLWADLPR